jgi:3-hydroxyacyl-[acyl-carrier-protein] dehydratase
MRYLLVDRILEYRSGEHIRGIKNVAMSEDFLEFHFPGNPIMPGVLLIEALAQLAGWLEAVSSDFSRWFLITAVKKCNFYGFVLPGDRVELEVAAKQEEGSPLMRCSGICSVEGRKKVKVDFEGELVPLSSIENVEDQRRFFKILTREFSLS